MAEPLFSIIMPVYNHASYVAEAIESIRSQQRTDWELWLVDDGSTDGSEQICDAAAARDERIRVLHQANAGPAAARNAGVARSRGRWLAFLDSDDLYSPTALEDFASFLAARPEAEFVYGYRHRLNENGTVTELPAEHQDRATGAGELFQQTYLSHLCVCYRRELFEKVGGYNERLREAEDYDLFLRMGLHARFHPLGKATGLRRRHGENLSRQTGYNRMVQAVVLRRFLERLGGDRLVPPQAAAERLGKVYFAAGKHYFKQGYFRQAAETLRLARSYRPSAKATWLGVAARILSPFGKTDRRKLPDL